MERILNEDERMRRAEEIYLRRNNKSINIAQEEYHKPKPVLGSKILLNLLILLDMAVIIFCIQNKDFIFTEEFLKQCSQYNFNITENMNKLLRNVLVENTVSDNVEKNIVDENTNQNMQDTNTVVQSQEQSQESQDSAAQVAPSIESSLSEMNSDVENLKQSYSFIKPLSAVISSGFGARESAYQNVTGYHKGIDLAAEKGTSIKASMEGIVTLVSSEGDYRKTCKDQMQ